MDLSTKTSDLNHNMQGSDPVRNCSVYLLHYILLQCISLLIDPWNIELAFMLWIKNNIHITGAHTSLESDVAPHWGWAINDEISGWNRKAFEIRWGFPVIFQEIPRVNIGGFWAQPRRAKTMFFQHSTGGRDVVWLVIWFSCTVCIYIYICICIYHWSNRYCSYKPTETYCLCPTWKSTTLVKLSKA